MINLRLYRLAFAPALLAVIVLMFSLEGAPDAVEPASTTATFDGERATADARRIVALAPDREPGSSGDNAVADLVTERFKTILTGAVSEQRFEAEVDGESVSLRNVLLSLPGNGDGVVVIVAGRDSPDAPGAASSAAATGVLLELASSLGVGQQTTYVLASTSGDTTAATGTRAVLDALPDRDTVNAVIVISQPGSIDPVPPHVIDSSTGESSGSVQLERTAERAIGAQTPFPAGGPSAFTQLARLAIPSGLGAQAPLIADGFDAIAISSAGERPLEASADGVEDLSGETVDAFGRAVQSTVAAIDLRGGDLEHGPSIHVELGDNLVPGWALSLLALTLILPAAAAAVDACARVARGPASAARGIAWAAARSLPFVGAFVVLYALALVGAVPRPAFPFDPGLYEFGTRAAIVLAAMLLAAAAQRLPASFAPGRRGDRDGRGGRRPRRGQRRGVLGDLAREPVPGTAARSGRSSLAARRGSREGPPHRPRGRRDSDRLRARVRRRSGGCGRAQPRHRRPVDIRDHGRRRSDRARDRRAALLPRRRVARRDRGQRPQPPRGSRGPPLAEIERALRLDASTISLCSIRAD